MFWSRPLSALPADASQQHGNAAADPARPLTGLGLFRHLADEDAYVLSAWADIAARLRLLGLAGGAVFLLASIVDWTKLHDTPQFWQVLLARLAVLALGLYLWHVASRQDKQPAALRRALIAFEIAGIVGFRLVNLAYGGYSPNQGMSGLLMVLAFYTFVPMLSRWNFWLLPLSTATLFIQSAWWYGASARDLAALAVIALFVHALGWTAAVRSARGSRQSWLERQRLDREMDERRAAESNLRHLFEVCPVPLVLSQQADDSVLRLNRAAQTLLDPAQRHPTPGSARMAGFYADDAARSAITQALRRSGEAGPTDVRMRNSNGQGLHVLLAARTLRFDGQPAILTSLVEITERKQRELALARQTETDALTGLFNRRGFFDRAAALLQAQRGALPSLLLLDADHFKRVNDTHGHAVGDAVLLQLSSRMAAALRDDDVLARIGGEEFAVLLPSTPIEHALHLAERLREAVARHALRVHGARVTMSLSIGVTALRPGELRIDAALSRADAAMYRAKQGGRNRVECADPVA